MTFDGLYYSYQGNCTYVLVEEIDKKVDNFGVYIDNYHCDAQDVVSCPRTLIVRHETQEVRIATVEPNTVNVEGLLGVYLIDEHDASALGLQNWVTVNKQPVALPYKKFGVHIYESGINCVVEIPELKMNVTYNGLSFSIRMPYSLFGSNTQGQCGTCNNNTADDCMLPNGNIAQNCETMADHWQVVDPSKPQCSPGLVPTNTPDVTTRQPCQEAAICELLLGSVFKPCHDSVNPENYYKACIFDSCMLPSMDLECSSLQIYALTCADQGVCIDWRSHTNGVCPYNCPSGKEYQACGPTTEITCKSSEQNATTTKQTEGCFCPNGTMLFDHSVDVCVKTCECNTSLCTATAPKCTPGFEVQTSIPSGQCCPVYECVPKKVCVHENAEFLPNSSIFIDKCQNCICTNDVNPSTQLNIISCQHVPCDVTCQEPGEFQNDPYNNCTIYSCVNIHDQLISSTSEITCPAFNEDSCKPGTISFLPNGCCKTCTPLESSTPCSVREREDFIVYNGCRSVDRVVVTECEGACGTFSLYSAESNSLDHTCSCCRESKSTMKEVVLKCPHGHSISHKYVYVESCSCQDTECSISQSEELETIEENDNTTTLNRIRRAISSSFK
ncbi:PREDICTED: intestinal mucin-like protein [Buceros rhinoceros silvestris]|uniref:intestinal mucin-like protein n=1 Tax=Buceros rhinoceros silvestris TaxID=175836 RepID=UPI0005284215|nr:PREDICTED: intestinal mucin-like protein [Buceros rhinoceros silvestris]